MEKNKSAENHIYREKIRHEQQGRKDCGKDNVFDMNEKIRILIVDDLLTIRAMMDSVISDQKNMRVSGVASSAEEAINDVRGKVCNLVLLDINMPGTDGLSFLDHIMRECPLPVIILSSAAKKGSDIVTDALMRGAAACYDKSKLVQNADGLIQVINAVHAQRDEFLNAYAAAKAAG